MRVSYLSSHIVCRVRNWPEQKILTDPALQETATKDRTLVAIVLCIKKLPEYLYQ